MEVTPDEYHARRAIMRSVADRSMKTVNLEIQKGDESTIIRRFVVWMTPNLNVKSI